jgi:hypothetical protein
LSGVGKRKFERSLPLPSRGRFLEIRAGARHGSWNRTKKVGGDIAVAKLNEDGTAKAIEPFLTGFLKDNKYVGRPADVAIMKDRSLLRRSRITSRISSEGSRVALN